MKRWRKESVSIAVWLGSAAVFAFGLWMAVPAGAQFRSRDRILEPVDASRWSVSRGHLRASARPEFDQGELNPATRLGRVTMFFRRTPEQEAGLQSLLDQLQDRSSMNYHRWLSPEEFADRFGLSQGDVDKVAAWLRAQGLQIEQVSRSRTWVAFSGTAQQVKAALRTDLRRYAVRGETRFMMSREPSVPTAFADVVLGFRGLDDFRLKPRTSKLQRRFTSELSGNHFLAPGDLARIYNLTPLFSAGIDGTGQTVAVAGQSAIDIADVQTFRSLSGLPPNDPQIILVPSAITGDDDPEMVDGDIDESYLDIEWVGAVARNATIKYVYSDNVLDAFFYIIDENLAPVISISYGACEDPDGDVEGFTQGDANFLASIAQEANAKGITIVAPAGDSGAADCDYRESIADQGLSVDLPGGLPYATSVGGTRFNEGTGIYWGPATNNPNTALSYIPETSWNDTDLPGVDGLAATGGGSSIYFSKPSWQTGAGVPNDGARDVPDVSFNASANHDGYLVCARDISTDSPTCVSGFRDAPGGFFTVFGGTSAGVPVFAGIVALINQAAGTPAGQGNVNYILYPLAASHPSAFHDITTGDNRVPCETSPPSPDCPTTSPALIGYPAGPGYDPVTGLGSVDAHALVTAWTSVSSTVSQKGSSAGSTAPDFQLALSPPSLAINEGGSATAQLTITGFNGFTGTVTVNCSASASLTCTVAGTGNSRTITVSTAGFGSFPAIGPTSWPKILLFGLWFAAVGLGVSITMLTRRPRWALALLFASLLVGCKGGGDSTVDPPAEGTVTVQATSGSITHTAQLSVTRN
jgi:subtilase family serine protease